MRRPRVIVGVCGGIAAYKTAILVRRLKDWGAEVVVVPTRASLDMVGKTTWEALSGHPVYVDVPEQAHQVVHVRTGQDADLIVIAPASANTMAKIAAGFADNLLTASVLVATCPVILAPAMHTEMWLNPATQANAATLKARGVLLLGPANGRLTGVDCGLGRMVEPEDIARRVIEELENRGFNEFTENSHNFTENPLHVNSPKTRGIMTISAGGTHEPIDPVRFIGNRSTGVMGISIAQAAVSSGFTVRFAAANIEASLLNRLDPAVEVKKVESAQELQKTMTYWATDSDVIVMAAAVADFRVDTARVKIKRNTGRPVGTQLVTGICDADIVDAERTVTARSLTLIENPDILADLSHNRRRAGQIIVGFAAETGDTEKTYIDYGIEKARRKGADFLAINRVGRDAGFGEVETELTVVDGSGVKVDTFAGSKIDVAYSIVELIARNYDMNQQDEEV